MEHTDFSNLFCNEIRMSAHFPVSYVVLKPVLGDGDGAEQRDGRVPFPPSVQAADCRLPGRRLSRPLSSRTAHDNRGILI